MAIFTLKKDITTEVNNIEVTVSAESFIPVGLHKFQLIVVDDSGNQSAPATVEVIVKDTKLPTAVLRGPGQVDPAVSFKLSGEGSSDVPPGKVVKFIWTWLE